MPDFLLPDLGEGLTEAEIVNWLVTVGDEVALDQPVVEVETAKAVVEVPVPYAGIVTAVHARPGESLAVGAPLITIGGATMSTDTGSDSTNAADGGFTEVGIVLAPATDGAEEGSGNVLIGYGTSAAKTRRRVRGRIPGSAVRTTPERTMSRPEPTAPQPAAPAGGVGVISPVVRTLARQWGVNVATIAGTGAGGTVRRHDVEREIGRRTDAKAPTSPGNPQGKRDADPELRRIPMTGIRRLVAEKMSRSRREIPEATVWVDVDATDMLAARAVINERHPQRKVSILALFAKFAILGLSRYPELNGRIDGNEIVLPAYVHLGVAAQTDRGLVVPVVRDAEKMSSRDLSEAIASKAAGAKAGKLAPQHLSGSTFTVNNYGVFGVDGSAAIINHPEVAILGMGRIIDRPWVVDGAVVARKITQLSLVFDHRVCDGGVAGGYLRFVADCVETPIGDLGDI
jgi:2-oxoisovalerate dehydrogenase E2 component (dihydrolipoyl transacylase)